MAAKAVCTIADPSAALSTMLGPTADVPGGVVQPREELPQHPPDEQHELVQPQAVNAEPLLAHSAEEDGEIRVRHVGEELSQNRRQAARQRGLQARWRSGGP